VAPPVGELLTVAHDPAQIVLPAAVTTGDEQSTTVTFDVTVLLHDPAVTVCVTVYVPAFKKAYEKFVEVPVTTGVVGKILQELLTPPPKEPVLIKFMVDPVQIVVVGEGVNVAETEPCVAIVNAWVELHPAASFTVIVYPPGVEIVIVGVVLPLLHK